jgi:hypothetical protein
MKKIKLGDIFVMFLILGLGLASYLYVVTEEDKSTLVKRLKEQNALLADTKKRDSLYTLKNKTYSKIIGKYVNGSTFVINGKKYTSDDILKLYLDADYKQRVAETDLETYKKLNNENASTAEKNRTIANTAINDYNETVTKYNPRKYKEFEMFHTVIKKRYGLDYSITKTDTTITLELVGERKIDSALQVFKDLRPNLKFQKQ